MEIGDGSVEISVVSLICGWLSSTSYVQTTNIKRAMRLIFMYRENVYRWEKEVGIDITFDLRLRYLSTANTYIKTLENKKQYFQP